VGGKPIVRLTISGRKATNTSIAVQNAGQGRMPGKVVSDSPWLVVDRPWLDPTARDQTVVVTLRPDQLTARAGVGTITVVTDHGERKVVSFEVSKRSFAGPMLGVLALVALGWGLSRWVENRPEPVAEGVPELTLRIDPFADRVLVDDRLVTSGALAVVQAPKPGAPFKIRIETDGFSAHEELVSLGTSSIERAVRLELTDAMNWEPPDGTAASLLDESAVDPLRKHAREMGRCFPEGAKRRLTMQATIRATADGQIRFLSLGGEGVDLKAGRECVARIVRGVRLAPFGGVWGQSVVPIDLEVGS
jgi:hypothetical protein